MTRPDGPVRHRLVLLRHAKAEHHGGVPDDLRALTSAGRRQAGLVGELMADAGIAPDLVLCSTSKRTRETYELLAAGLLREPAVEHTDDLYATGSSRVIKILRSVPEGTGTVLVVGHEPTMSDVAEELAGSDSNAGAVARARAGIPTGAFCVLDVATRWSELAPGRAVLTGIVVAPHDKQH